MKNGNEISPSLVCVLESGTVQEDNFCIPVYFVISGNPIIS